LFTPYKKPPTYQHSVLYQFFITISVFFLIPF